MIVWHHFGRRLIKGITKISDRTLIVKFMRNPRKYFYYLFQGKVGMYCEDLKSLGIPKKSIVSYTKELRADKMFYQEFFAKIKLARKINPSIGGMLAIDFLEIIYAIVRYYQPNIIVETGVGPGSTSAFILKALNANANGMLYSIDLPGFDKEYYPTIDKHYDIHIPEGWEVGWLIPSSLKHRWQLILGDAKSELPKLLGELGSIDIFLHDSLHTYEHMMFEYNCAFNHLRDSGILISDDVNEYWSLSFIDFCKRQNIQWIVLDNRLGIAKNDRWI